MPFLVQSHLSSSQHVNTAISIKWQTRWWYYFFDLMFMQYSAISESSNSPSVCWLYMDIAAGHVTLIVLFWLLFHLSTWEGGSSPTYVLRMVTDLLSCHFTACSCITPKFFGVPVFFLEGSMTSFQISIWHHGTAWQMIGAHCTKAVNVLMRQCTHQRDRAKLVVKEQLDIFVLWYWLYEAHYHIPTFPLIWKLDGQLSRWWLITIWNTFWSSKD